MLEVTWPIFICHHGFPVATGSDNPEMDVNTNSFHNTFKAINVSRVLTGTQNRHGEVSWLTNSLKMKTTGYSFTYGMCYKDIIRAKSAQPTKSSRR